MLAEGIQKRILAGGLRRAARRAGGVVDQHMQRTSGDEGIDRGAQADGIGHISREKTVTLRAGVRQRIDHRAQRVGASRHHGDIGAEQGEFVRGRAADALGRATDERVFAAEIEIHGRPVL